MRSVVVGIATFIAVAALSACYDNPTSPMRPRPPVPLRSVSGPIGTHSITIPPLNDLDHLGAVTEENTGIFLPDNSTTVITVTGTVTLHTYSGYAIGPHAGGGSDVSISGQVVPPTGTIRNGVATQELMVKYHLEGQSFTPSLTPDSANPANYSFTYRAAAGGKLLVGRSGVRGAQICVTNSYPPNLPPSCITPSGSIWQYDVPAYTMSGAQTISATRLDDDVTLTAVNSTGAKGRLVTFTATSPMPGGGVWSWVWTPDSTPGQTVACSSAVNPCVINVYESGTMDVTFYVTSIGLVRHAKAHAYAVDCPTGDSLGYLDTPTMRSGMASLWSASDPANPDSSARRERGGVLYRVPGADSLIFKPFPDLYATPCSNHVIPDNSVPQSWIVAFVHTHPFHHGNVLPTSDSTCTKDPTLVYAYDALKYGGPSLDDWRVQQTSNQVPDGPGLVTFHSVPFYVIDADRIYRGDATRQPSEYTKAPKWKRNTGSCTVL
jgi:hypothetical protein